MWVACGLELGGQTFAKNFSLNPLGKCWGESAQLPLNEASEMNLFKKKVCIKLQCVLFKIHLIVALVAMFIPISF